MGIVVSVVVVVVVVAVVVVESTRIDFSTVYSCLIDLCDQEMMTLLDDCVFGSDDIDDDDVFRRSSIYVRRSFPFPLTFRIYPLRSLY